MKWFHHECAARHDPKLQVLGASHGADGLGIYWGLLEEIGQHSDTFHLKVMGINGEADEQFSDFLRYPQTIPQNPFGNCSIITAIPRLPVKLLAKNLFTSPKKLQAVVAFCIEVGLFDARKWLEFNVLYSPSFEHRADDYTRRTKRATNIVRTGSEQTSDNVRTLSEQSTNTLRTLPTLSTVEGSEVATDNVRLETDTETEGEEKKNRNRTEEKMLLKNTPSVDKSKSINSVNLSSQTTSEASPPDTSGGYLIEPNDKVFDEYSLQFHSMIQKWNRENPVSAIDWEPATAELKKLFYAGEYERKLSMCFHAYKLLGGKINYPELVIRALRLMLSTNAKAKIDNPFGWLWTCLHGSGNGTLPWVQLYTAEEENRMFGKPERDSR